MMSKKITITLTILIFLSICLFFALNRYDNIWGETPNRILVQNTTENLSLKWKIKTENKIRNLEIVDSSVVVLQTRSGEIIVYDLSNGKEIWNYQSNPSRQYLKLFQVSSNYVFVNNGNQNIVALNLSDGGLVWDLELPAIPSSSYYFELYDEKLLFVARAGNTLAYGINPDTGSIDWSNESLPPTSLKGGAKCPEAFFSFKSSNQNYSCLFFADQIYVIDILLGSILEIQTISSTINRESILFDEYLITPNNIIGFETDIFNVVSGENFTQIAGCDNKISPTFISQSSFQVVISNACGQIHHLWFKEKNLELDLIYSSEDIRSNFAFLNEDFGYIVDKSGAILEFQLKNGLVTGSIVTESTSSDDSVGNELFISYNRVAAIVGGSNLFFFEADIN